MKIISFFLFPLFISLSILAEERIIGKSLQLAAYSDEERLEALEKENQHLLSRIEMLEHNLAKLEKILNIGKQEELLSGNAKAKSLESDTINDIFEISTNKEIVSKTNNNPVGNVNKDKQLYDLALASLKDNKLEEAEKSFAEFLKNYPNSSFLSNGYFWYGETFFKRNMFKEAAINYLKGYKQSPKGSKAADSLLKLALALGALNKNQEACSMLIKLEAKFPHRPSTSVTKSKEAKIKFGCKK